MNKLFGSVRFCEGRCGFRCHVEKIGNLLYTVTNLVCHAYRRHPRYGPKFDIQIIWSSLRVMDNLIILFLDTDNTTNLLCGGIYKLDGGFNIQPVIYLVNLTHA